MCYIRMHPNDGLHAENTEGTSQTQYVKLICRNGVIAVSLFPFVYNRM